MAQDERRWGFIDGLRGALALWVVAGHALNATRATFGQLSQPALAVDVFMLISGFLMAEHFFARAAREPWESPRTWGRFYLRRFLRIAPVYFLALAAAFACLARYRGFYEALYPEVPSSAVPLLPNVLLHYTFLFGFFPPYVASVAAIPDWSIALEMQFYLAFPFLMLALRRWGAVTIALAAVLIDFVAHKFWGVYVGSEGWLGVFPYPSFLPLKIGWFVAGILIAESGWRRARGETARAVLSGGLALFFGCRGQPFVLCAITFGFIVLAHRDVLGSALAPLDRAVGLVDRVLGSRPGALLADCSFGLYVIHLFALFPLAMALRASPLVERMPPLAHAGILFVATIAVALPLALVLHRLVEQPGIDFGRHLLRTRTPGPAPGPALAKSGGS